MPQRGHLANLEIWNCRTPARTEKFLMPIGGKKNSNECTGRRVLVVPDKFKGTLTAAQAAEAIAHGWQKSQPSDVVEQLPMSDGGDGFGEVMSSLLRARAQTIQTVDAAHRPCKATWWWASKTKTAIIESAKIIGLAMLPPGKYHPVELDTFGLGTVLEAAQDAGAKEILIGIGGSATNDGGFGLARRLGWNFYDERGRLIEKWPGLSAVAKIQPPQRPRISANVIVAVDVQNPLLGPLGATRIYGPQKGIRPQDMTGAEHYLGQLAAKTEALLGRDFASIRGAGAAGGLGFGLFAFLGATPKPGFGLFARHAKLKKRLEEVDLVVTGEGSIDESTLMGKGTGQIAGLCTKHGIDCIGLAGCVAPDARRNKLFARTAALTDLTTIEKAKEKPALWLERLAAQVASPAKIKG